VRAVTRTRALIAVLGISLLTAAPAAASAAHDGLLVRRGIAHALVRHWIKAPDARRYRATVSRALHDVRVLPPLRGRALAAQLAQLTPLWDSYTSPRALALFSQLEVNASYLETHRIPEAKTDVAGPDGVVYRWFPSLGLEFHPLASFGALNAAAAAGDVDATRTLADALLARAIPRGGRLIWEYSFRFGGGRPPWASGMAQAVAAQALARSATLLEDTQLVRASAATYASVPPFVVSLPSGPWIRLYGFDREIVLNAQLQTIVSLLDYAQATGDANASSLAARLDATAQALFARFDTGDWSRYELGGGYASHDYQSFVTDLLAKLASRTQDPFWIDAARRFHGYLYDGPQVTEGTPPPTLYPQPLDGYLDTATIPIVLSQRAAVTMSIAGKVLTWRLAGGPHALTWTPPPGLAPGTYPVSVSAVGYAGIKKTTQLVPIVVAWETEPPVVTASLGGTTLTWQATDPGTPWLELQVTLTDPAGANPPQTIDLGHQPLAGGLALAIPAGTWEASLVSANSAGLATVPQDLGPVTSPG
jgi:hypothetical protein